MQKNAYKIIALTLLLMLLCGCKQSRSLGERAIVKMVYLDCLLYTSDAADE